LNSTSQYERAKILDEICFQFVAKVLPDSIGTYQRQLNELATQLNDRNLKALADSYLVPTNYLDTAKFRVSAIDALASAKAAACAECEGMIYLSMGLRARKSTQLSVSVLNFKKGIKSIENLDSKRILVIRTLLLTYLSSSYHQQGNLSEALLHGLDAMRIAELLKNDLLKQRLFIALSAVYGGLSSDTDKLGDEADRARYRSLAKSYKLKAYNASLRLSNERDILISSMNLGVHYTSEEKNTDSALYYLNRAIAIGTKDYLIESMSYTLSYAYNIKGNALMEINQDSALYYFDKAIAFGKKAGTIGEARGMISKVHVLRKRGRKAEAIALANQALAVCLRSEEKATTINAYEVLIDLHEENGDIKQAYDYFKKYIAVKDKMVSDQNFARIEELKTKYESDLKDEEIKNLAQKTSIQTLEIKQKNYLLLGVIAGALLVAAFIYLYFNQRTLRHQQKTLEIENRFLRFQLDPHFISNALVSIQRFIMENNTTQAAGYLTKFSRLMRQLLEYSREELITIEEEIDLLHNYLDIQKLRLKDKFEYEIKIDPNLSITDAKIQPMFAQPFLENAIEHGVSHIENGKIEVSFSSRNDQLVLEIKDNGKGLSTTPLGGQQSLSTKIIRERIALLNKTNKSPIHLAIKNVAEGSGTLVHLTLPIYS
jgi:hypothetical protein